jgi:hypothetical protein
MSRKKWRKMKSRIPTSEELAKEYQANFDRMYTTPAERWLHRRLYGDKSMCGGCGQMIWTELERYFYSPDYRTYRCLGCARAVGFDMGRLFEAVD